MKNLIKKEEINKNKRIVYEIHTDDNNQYRGITIDIIDPNDKMADPRSLSINPALYVHNIVTNFNPVATSHPITTNMDFPEECYIVDGDLQENGLGGYFNGEYLGNIIFNTPNGKKIACFISKGRNESQRQYKFLDLTFGNILADTEWDIDAEYLGFSTDTEGHQRYLRLLREFKTQLEFTTQISNNREEKLVDCNEGGITEEGIKKFNIFKRNILDIIEKGYKLLETQNQEKTCIEEDGIEFGE